MKPLRQDIYNVVIQRMVQEALQAKHDALLAARLHDPSTANIPLRLAIVIRETEEQKKRYREKKNRKSFWRESLFQSGNAEKGKRPL